MRRGSHLRAAAVLAALVLLLVGCASAPVAVSPADAPGALPQSLAQFAASGGSAVTVTAGELTSQFGCKVEYELHEPVGWPDSAPSRAAGRAPTVVLAHGFMRDLTAMRGWASHWASHGVRTVVVSFCNSSWLDGRHDRNAMDMIAVADRIVGDEDPDGPVIYAGFSAGGLAGLLAASGDSRAVAYLGLDAVDSGELAAPVMGDIPPSLFLFGEPSACNADSNMAPLVPERSDVTALRIPYATHCDFENPHDPACERVCGSVEPEETAKEIRRTIGAVATAWIVAGGQIDRPEADGFLQELSAARRVNRL